jgi:hypothetical protein
MPNNPENESTNKKLRSENALIAYLEIDTRLFDTTTQDSFQKIKNLYEGSFVFSELLAENYPQPPFKVKIYANIVVIADDFMSEWDAHTGRRLRSLMRMNYFLAAFQHLALVKYNWLVRGYMTTGQLYMPHIFEDEGGMPQGTDIDFLWGKALVEAYKKNKKNQYPGIEIDASILDFCDDQKINRIIWDSSHYEYSKNPKIIFLDFLGVFNNISTIGDPELRIQKFSDTLDAIEKKEIFPEDQLIFLKTYLDHVKAKPQIPRQQPSVKNNIVDPEPFTSPVDTTEMKEYFIAYLDMLGTEDKIEDDDDDRWLNAMEEIYDASSHDILKSNNQKWIEMLGDLGERMVSYLTPQIKIFSDNILFAIEEVDDDLIEAVIKEIPTKVTSYLQSKGADDALITETQTKIESYFQIEEGEDTSKYNMIFVDELMKYTGYFQNYALLKYNWQLRGCVTKGQLYLDEKYMWGPVIIQANDLEKNAKEPRIILDTMRLSVPILEGKEGFYESDDLKLIIQKDDDMMHYIGYEDLILNGTKILNIPEQCIQYLRAMKSSLCELYGSNIGDGQVLPKIEWAIKYHNEVCKRWNVDARIEL